MHRIYRAAFTAAQRIRKTAIRLLMSATAFWRYWAGSGKNLRQGSITAIQRWYTRMIWRPGCATGMRKTARLTPRMVTASSGFWAKTATAGSPTLPIRWNGTAKAISWARSRISPPIWNCGKSWNSRTVPSGRRWKPPTIICCGRCSRWRSRRRSLPRLLPGTWKKNRATGSG